MNASTTFHRADHVGSLVAPPALVKARARFVAGSAPREELTEAEDRAVAQAVRRQRDCGLPGATDGGFRRPGDDFLAGLTGVERVAGKAEQPGAPTLPGRLLVTDRLRFPPDHQMVAGFRFLAGETEASAKAVLPSPGALHQGLAADALHVAAYREEEALFSDLRDLYAGTIAALHAAGCRRLQFDDDAFFALAVRGGPDARRLAEAYAGALREALASKPADLTATLFLGAGSTPGSAPSTQVDAFADLVLGQTGSDVFLIDPAVVPVEALRYLPAGKRALLGLVDAGMPDIERLDDIRRALDDAGQHTDPERLGIAPHRGFADVGESIGEDAQWRKLDFVVRAAERIWGSTLG